MHKGSCLCGAVRYEIKAEFNSASNCYCTMCQKQHGAACGTYGSVFKKDITFEGSENLVDYQSSTGIHRRFCKHCGSSLIWDNQQNPELLSIALGSLDTEYDPPKVNDIFIDTKPRWFKTEV